MCGIVGYFERDQNPVVIDRMLEEIAHRGPDGKTKFQENGFTLGHRRLAIIDLVSGDQPMFDTSDRFVIIYNGEIYNYPDLKEELVALGHVFQTNSDTEVILEAYKAWGPSSLARLNGIFAFVIYDRTDRLLFLARDHFGIKPLHYYRKDDLFIFCSEQKGILVHPKVERKLNRKALHYHLNLRYTPGTETLFHGIRRLPPAHYMTFVPGKVIKIEKYWSPPLFQPQYASEKILRERFNDYLLQAVKRQLISDVPVGVYLSGGLDSSSIVQKIYESGVRDINTFTLGFNEPTDEFGDAKLVATTFNTNHKELSLSLNPLEKFPAVIWHAEEPKINLLQGYNMSDFVSNHVKVVLGGLGGDELMAGYDIHRFIYPFNRLFKGIPEWFKKVLQWKSDFLFKIQNQSKTLRFDEYRRGMQMLLSIGHIERFYLILRNVWDFDHEFAKNIYTGSYLESLANDEVPQVLKEFQPYFDRAKISGPLDQVLYAEMATKMVDDYLLVEDRMSMSHSVEERVPFLDLDLVKFTSTIPISLKIKKNNTKAFFREAMAGHLPEQILRKKKWGFTVNPYLQFKKDLKTVAEAILTEERINEQGIFNYSYIRRILDTRPSAKMRWHYNYLWIVLGLAIWEDIFINGHEIAKNQLTIENFYN